MQTVSSDSTIGARARPLSAGRYAGIMGGVFAIVGLWFAMRPYAGIVHDSRIYLGRAWADMDPTGLGRDLMFAHDGQSGFSIFSRLLRPAVELWGPTTAMAAISAAGLLLWLAAAAALFSRFFSGRALWAALIGVAVISADYGGHGVFKFGEAFATPRLFSEVAALLALALVLDRRWILSALLIGLAGALHPIMALPAAAVWFVMLVAEDRRWLVLPLIGGVAGLIGAVLGAPLLDRLFMPIDRQWLEVLQGRAPYLFPPLWPAKSVVLFLFQAVVVGLAAAIVPPRARLLFWVSLGLALAGLVVTVLAPTLLVVQMQAWRAQWLLAVIAAGTFPWLVVTLMAGDQRNSAVAGFLIAAVLFLSQPWLAGPACLCALAARFAQPEPGFRLFRTAAWTTAACGLGWVIALSVVIARALVTSPSLEVQGPRMSATILASALVLLLSIAWLRWGTPGRLAGSAAVRLSLGVVALLVGVLNWDGRPDFVRAREEGRGGMLLPARLPPGEIFWLDGDLTSYNWTRRPQWWLWIQGAPTVFDRELAIEWGRRWSLLKDAGVEWRTAKFGSRRAKRVGDLDGRAMSAICGDAVAPSAVVAPLPRGAPALRASADVVWSPHAKVRKQQTSEQTFVVLRCSSFRK